jgi:hypothetical protein
VEEIAALGTWVSKKTADQILQNKVVNLSIKDTYTFLSL